MVERRIPRCHAIETLALLGSPNIRKSPWQKALFEWQVMRVHKTLMWNSDLNLWHSIAESGSKSPRIWTSCIPAAVYSPGVPSKLVATYPCGGR